MNLDKISCAELGINYFIQVGLWTIGLRILFSILRAIEAGYKDQQKDNEKFNNFINSQWYVRTWTIFKGFSTLDPKPDFWYNTILGTFELLTFPILMTTDSWEAIGAWIGFKAIAQWNTWTDDRLVFNRFLIANAVVLTISFLILKDLIK